MKSSSISTTTKFPVVFIHGVFGFGKTRPMWNHWLPYWPDKALDELNENHVVLHVGPLTSNHDRACEAFYQLFGGQVDYGEQHSRETGHARYGATFATALHPNWSASRRIHLVGHSFGATTALELFQLLCVDFFEVGSDYRWVKSIVSIAGPLTGSTVTHLVGVRDGKMTRGSPIYLLYVAFVLWFKLYKAFPVLKRACDIHWDQWSGLSMREMLAVNGPMNASQDLGVHDAVPSRCMERNARIEHLDKLYLLTIMSSSMIAARPIRDGMALSLFLLLILRHKAFRTWRRLLNKSRLLRVLFTCYLIYQLKCLNVVTLPILDIFKWISHWHVKTLSSVVPGCDPHEWGPNDGFVNTHSMKEPWHPNLKPIVTVRVPVRLKKGRWYSWSVRVNHFVGTYWDNDAAELYRTLFARIAREHERDELEVVDGCTLQIQLPNTRATWIFRRNQSQESLRSE